MDKMMPKFYFNCGQDYSQFFQSCNWYDFRFVQLCFDYTPENKHISIDIAIIGFWLSVDIFIKGDEFYDNE